MLSAREDLDDEHQCAAMSAQEGGLWATVIGMGIWSGSGWHRRRLMQQLADGGDIVFAIRVGEDAVVADAMKA